MMNMRNNFLLILQLDEIETTNRRGRKIRNEHVVQQVVEAREGMDYNEQEDFQDDDEKILSDNEGPVFVMCGVK